MKTEATYQRINITLPLETLRLLERVSRRGDRSSLIDHALLHYLNQRRRAQLRQQLTEGYRFNRKISRELAEVWRPLEEEVWQKTERK